MIKILKILSNKNLGRYKQNLFFKNNNFDLKKISSKLDQIGFNILNKTFLQKDAKHKKILHIANFNENADGRLYYSFQINLIMDLLKTTILFNKLVIDLFKNLIDHYFNPLAQ